MDSKKGMLYLNWYGKVASRFHFIGFLSLRKEIKQAKKVRKPRGCELFCQGASMFSDNLFFFHGIQLEMQKEHKPVASIDCLAVSVQTGPEQYGWWQLGR